MSAPPTTTIATAAASNTTIVPSNRSLPPASTTSTPTAVFLDRFISSIAAAFQPTAVTTALICELDTIAPPYPPSASPTIESPISHARRVQHFANQIRESVVNPPSHAAHNAILTEAGGWAAVASWEPPSYTGPPFSQAKSNAGPLHLEWHVATARMRAQYIGYASESTTDAPGPQAETSMSGRNLKPHYHLAFLGRIPGREDVKGAIRAVIVPFLAKAREEGVPVWLEATYPHAVAVYEHYGFRVCEEVTMGVGHVGGDGWPKEGGEGVKAWGMLWDGKDV